MAQVVYVVEPTDRVGSSTLISLSLLLLLAAA